MCGRYTLRSRSKAKFYGVPESELPMFEPRYNIAPTQIVPAIIEQSKGRKVELLQWGLVPSWSKDANGFINARAETIETKRSFADSFLNRRCLIPADGFYEWARRGKRRQPYFFQLKAESSFAFAGVWDRWRGAERALTSCAIVTTEANELVMPIHDRMPVILDEQAQEKWLTSDTDPRELRELLAPFPAAEMKSFPVSEQVNYANFDAPELVLPVELKEELTTGWLF